jgi:hypothetical protein
MLTEIVLPNSVTTIGDYSFHDCKALERISFGKSLNKIGQYAFSYDEALKNVKLPNSVTQVGTHSFSYCKNLTSISFGKSITNIGTNTFFEDNAISSIYCKAETPPAMSSINPHLEHLTTVYVPINSVEIYKTTYPWKWIEHIVGINFDSADVNGDGEINIADVNCCIDTIIDNNDTFDEVYDVNGDGEINIADINAIIAAILDGE